MDSDKYLKGQSMQRPPLFESGSFIYWKNRFETYVKSKDLNLWHVITNGDFQPIQQNLETKLDEVIPFEKQSDDLKKKLAKNNEAKMVIYNALPRKEYEKKIRCNTAKEIWKTLLITHQVLFARFNTIITSLKGLDEGYSSKNNVRKFPRSLHPKWRLKVTTIEESKDLTSLSFDEAKKESSDEECSTYESEYEEYAIAVRDFKKFFKRRGDRKCFRCGDPNHLIGECLKPPKDKNQRAFVGGSWIDSGEEDDEKVKDETCLVAQASSEVCSESSYFNDENSLIDDLVLDNEYKKLCKMSLKIITKNKILKATRNSLEKELSILKEKVSTLEKNKGIDLECVKCHMLKIENEKLKEEAIRLNKFEKSTHCLNEMLSNQKPSGEKLGLGLSSFEVSSSGTKKIKFAKAQKKASSDGDPINMGSPHIVKAALKIIMGPPVATPRSEKRQICDNKCRATFSEHDSEITKDGKVIGRGIRKKGLYVMKLGNKPKDKMCLGTINENSMLWHRRLGHANIHLIQSLASKELVRNLPKLKFDQHLCDACKIRKQAHTSHKAKNIVSTTRCLELLHMDLFGPSAVRSYGGNRYTLVIVDDYSSSTHSSIKWGIVACGENKKGHISIEKVPSVDNIADILTKPLKRESFNYLRVGLGMMEHIP
ncbi:retrovirus-related pol polyprotein from transposon TNT 1-94 [Tanacetum coccineum]